jgi:hypothetical protein
MVSSMVSPFLTLLTPGSANPVTEPPSRCIADSKLSLVLVLGSKNRAPIILPLAMSVPSVSRGIISSATPRMKSISSRP